MSRTCLSVVAALFIIFPMFKVDAAPATPVVPEGLVSLWSAEGNASDSVGPNNGEAKNGVTYVCGVRGQAFKFNGTDQYVDIGNPDSLRLSDSFSLAAWVNIESAPEGGAAAIITKWGQSVDTDAYGLYIRNDYGLKPDGAVGVSGNCECSPFGGGDLAANTWYHIAMTYDGDTGDNRIYIDGVLVASRIRHGGTTPSDRPVQIGRESTYMSRYFKGMIDEVRVYNRAISTSEINAIYDSKR